MWTELLWRHSSTYDAKGVSRYKLYYMKHFISHVRFENTQFINDHGSENMVWAV